MPLTPFHALSVLWFHFKIEKYFDPLALILSSSIVDLEPFFVLAFGLPYPDHGVWHTYFAGIVVSFLLTPLLYIFESKLRGETMKICGVLRVKCHHFPYSVKLIFLNCLLGTGFHGFLDGFTHEKMSWVLFPLYISDGNPFWFGMGIAMIFEVITIGLSLISCGLWVKFRKKYGVRLSNN